jgi:hypothetical protein
VARGNQNENSRRSTPSNNNTESCRGTAARQPPSVLNARWILWTAEPRRPALPLPTSPETDPKAPTPRFWKQKALFFADDLKKQTKPLIIGAKGVARDSFVFGFGPRSSWSAG